MSVDIHKVPKLTPCMCNEPGYCPRAQRKVSSQVWYQCRTSHSIYLHMVKYQRNGLKPFRRPKGASLYVPSKSIPRRKQVTRYGEECVFMDSTQGIGRVPCKDRAKKYVRLYSCEAYQQCTLRPSAVPQVQACQACPAYSPDDPPAVGPWIVGVTTSPLKDGSDRGTLLDTLEGLREAGWTDPIYVYAEPGSVRPQFDHMIWFEQSEKRGAWFNRWDLFKRMIEENEKGQIALLCEDDIVVRPDAKDRIESSGWPTYDAGLLSLYRYVGRKHGSGRADCKHEWDAMGHCKWCGIYITSPDTQCYPADSRGYQRVCQGQFLWGSLAMAIHKQAWPDLLEDERIHTRGGKSINMTDSRLWNWVHRSKWTGWVTKPSLVEHRVDVDSACGHGVGWSSRSSDFRADVCVITPTCDRPHAFRLCEKWMSRQTYGGKLQWIVVDDGKTPIQCTQGQEYYRREDPKPPRHSLCRNLKEALKHVSAEKVIIVEDDDIYSPNYLEEMSKLLDSDDLVGIKRSRYYHVTGRHTTVRGNLHSALHRTAFKANVIPAVLSCLQTDNPSVDLRLWKAWNGSKRLLDWENFPGWVVSLKGVPGKANASVRGSVTRWPTDPDLEVLKNWTNNDEEVIEWYSGVRDEYLFRKTNALTIYTAIFGEYDNLRPIHRPVQGVRYVCITDDRKLVPEGWDPMVVIPTRPPDFQNRQYKWLAPQKHFADSEWTLYLDANWGFHSQVHPVDMIRHLVSDSKAEFFTLRHRFAKDVYQEMERVKRRRLAPKALIDQQGARYRQAKYPRGSGAWHLAVMLRRNSRANFGLCSDVWKELKRHGHCRDQTVFPYVRWKHKIPVDHLKDTGRFASWHPHLVSRKTYV